MNTLICVAEVDALDKPKIFDCRFSLADESYGRLAFDQSHIPGAIHVDLNRDLSGRIIPDKTGRHPLPQPEQFEALVRQWGLDNEQQVVAYDDGNGAYAARLWWMLRWLGHGNVAVLDGGFGAWMESGNPVTTSTPETQVSTFESRSSLTAVINAFELAEYNGLITDARDLRRFTGESEPIDPIAGHIPNARCLPFTNNLTGSQRFKAVADLQQQFTDFGIPNETSTVCYCGSGVTAAHNILALVHAGYPEPTLYPGSWSEWITDPNNKIATGDG